MTADAAHIAAALYLLAGAAVCLLMAWRAERRDRKRTTAPRIPFATVHTPQPATDAFADWWDAWCRHFNEEITRGSK